MKIFKKVTIFLTLIFSLVLLAACEEEVEDTTLEDAHNNLTYDLILGENESKDEIKNNLSLINELEEVTITWESSNEDAITNEGTVFRSNEDILVTLEATLSYNDDTLNKEFDFKVIKEDEPEKMIAVETFDVTTLTQSYSEGEFVGVAGITYEYALARDEENYPIDGSGILIQKEGGYIKANIPHGLEEFSFDYRKAYTGGNPRDYVVEITHNDETETYVLDTFGEGSGADDTIHKFSVKDLGFSGEVTILIHAPEKAAQATFDNFTYVFSDDVLAHYINFDANGGTLNSPEKQLVFHEGKVLTPPNPELIGKNFDGWFLNDELYNFEDEVTGAFTLTAKWSDVEEISIDDFLKLNEGNHATIEGVITSNSMYNLFTIEDSSNAVVLKVPGKNAHSDLDFEVGSKVKALVKKTISNGLIQAEVELDVELEIDDELHEINDGINLDNKLVEEFEDYQAKLVNLTNLEVLSVQKTSFANNDLRIQVQKGEETLNIEYNDNFQSSLVDFVMKLEKGDLIDIVNAPLGFNNKPEIYISEITQIKPSDETTDLSDFYKVYRDVNILDIDTSEVKDEDGKTLELPSKSENDFDITWTVENGEDYIDLETGKITMPDETTNLILKATISLNDTEVSKTFEIRLWVKSIYGDDILLNLENLNIPGTGYDGGVEKPATVNGYEFVSTYTMVSGNEIQGQANNMRIWNNDSLGTINRIEITLRAPSDHELHVGNEANPTEKEIEAEVTDNLYVYNIEGDFSYFELHNLGGAIYIESIVIYYDN